MALGAGFAMIRVAKTAENATDYSVMNTGKAMLWLPCSREEKYKAKQAVDTFFVRVGDMLSGLLVFLGTAVYSWSISLFAIINLLAVLIWLSVTVVVYRQNRVLTQKS